MPEDLTALVVLVVAIFPGVAGELVYRAFAGVVSWRDTAVNNTFRVLGFSLGGATLYALIAKGLKLSPPNHLFPSTLETFGPDTYFAFFGPYIGHFICSAIAGSLVSFLVWLFARVSPVRTNRTVWDEFISDCVPGRWVAVNLKGGVTYVGKLVATEQLIEVEERDIILGEPARWSKEHNTYIAMNHQYLYLPASTVDTIGSYPKSGDSRTVAVGSKLFEESTNDQTKKTT